jgi:hypothetical protein
MARRCIRRMLLAQIPLLVGQSCWIVLCRYVVASCRIVRQVLFRASTFEMGREGFCTAGLHGAAANERRARNRLFRSDAGFFRDLLDNASRRGIRGSEWAVG